ncbi:primosomal protein N' [Pedobacter sp. BS3]|uniref:replication restart helicase PriA n=1 Tax=Pedobacter sp. BS3 TaxID=2567937 RepID=UPI0011EE96EC|nr:primosomal protein N' [Pedobacter sp. BS3]TZF84008.1 primosomal protein N' [Pedobacter sp. BS3]
MLELNPEHSERDTLFVEVILPLALSKTYTYRVPFNLNDRADIGKRVVVQFGKSKIYTAIVHGITREAPTLYEAKYIIDILDDEPLVNSHQLKLWQWMAGYYLCNLGDVMQAALPAALKLASETRIILLPDHGFDKAELNDKEYLIVDALEIQNELKVSDIAKLLGQKTVFPILKSLFDKNIIHISEEIVQRYQPRLKAFIRLNSEYADPESRKALFEILERAPKQMDALLAYLKLSRDNPEIAKSQLLEESGCGNSALKALLDKQIFVQQDKVVSRLSEYEEELLQHFVLSPAQQGALEAVEAQFEEKDVVLLQGVTASGKTQLYIRLIEKAIARGRQVLYLVPEIALTTQLIERLKKYFGNTIGVYHSKFSDNERAETWNKLLKNEYQIVLGARSSVFLPFSNLGLIVVDEEHEPSYKQFDPAPRYNARDSSVYLASIHRAKVLLGSATPALESYFNAKSGKFGLVNLAERFGEAQLPQIEIADIAEETRKKTIRGHFSGKLLDAIEAALARKEQVILFQNRRGYNPYLLCRSCGYSPKCINCDIGLTYHKSTGRLHCHLCGYKQETISVCPACGSVHIESRGFGTERIEEDLAGIFPDARIARMDLDATRTRNSFQRLITDLEERKIDILVGTQMVTKGLDFEGVTVIGIISADSLLNYPDFRAYERSFQLLSQVAGRSGRGNKPGTVIIQAYDVNHRVINQVIRHDYEEMARTELVERRNFNYPPYCRMIQLDFKHKNFQTLAQITVRAERVLKSLFGQRVIGPVQPLVAKVRNYYIVTFTLKIERSGVAINNIKTALKSALLQLEADKLNAGMLVRVDVDPA